MKGEITEREIKLLLYIKCGFVYNKRNFNFNLHLHNNFLSFFFFGTSEIKNFHNTVQLESQ